MFKKLLLLFVTGIFYLSSIAQSENKVSSTTHDYYICISGITGPADIEKLETFVQHKEGITFFQGDKYPVRYFTLKSTSPVSREQFISWIDKKLKVEYYGEGIASKEAAMLTYKKLKK